MLTKSEQMKVSKLKTTMFNKFQREAVKVIKTKPEWIAELKSHFKTGAWPLSYAIFLEQTGLYDVVFNIILTKLGYKIGLDKYTEIKIFKPRKKNVIRR